MSDTVFLKVTSAFLFEGKVARAGSIVEVNTATAKDILNRGKATLANEADAPKVATKPLAVGDTKEADEVETAPAAEADAPAEPKARGRKKGK